MDIETGTADEIKKRYAMGVDEPGTQMKKKARNKKK